MVLLSVCSVSPGTLPNAGASPVPCELRLQFRSVVLDCKGPCPRFAAGRTNPFPSARAKALPFVLPFGNASGLAPESLNSLKGSFAALARARACLPSGREMFAVGK
jgi:hypothetical protein